MLRPLCFGLCLLVLPAAVPGSAAEKRTAVIRLKYVSVQDFDRMIFPPESGDEGAGAGGGLGSRQNLIPVGIDAWSIDTRTNSVSVTGTDAAINDLQGLIRLVDVAPRLVRLIIRRFKLDAAAIKKLAGLQEVASSNDVQVSSMDETAMTALLPKPTERLEAATQNNIPIRVAWSPDGQSREFATFHPRVNGDDSITLFLSMPSLRTGARLPTSQLGVLQRIAVGQSILIYPKTGGAGLAITVRDLQTPEVGKEPG
jgi:hypothetical protein